MRKIFFIWLPFSMAFFSTRAQYIPAAFPETIYSSITPVSSRPDHYNVGTDTRGTFLPDYGNYLNVTVSDYDFSGQKKMFWESSSGGSGSINIPASDAQDPDVVLVEKYTGGLVQVRAMVVYYSGSGVSGGGAGYYLTRYTFTGGSFSTPVTSFIDGFVSGGVGPYINIDADSAGHYAIVYQYDPTTVRSVIGTTSSPGTTLDIHNNLIEPDIAVSNDAGATSAKIVGLEPNRKEYTIIDRPYPAGPGVAIGTFFVGSELHRPRIACSPSSSGDYAITMTYQHTSVTGSPVFDVIVDPNPATPPGVYAIINDGTLLGYPPAINYLNDGFPAISYYSQGVGAPDRLVVAWHTYLLPCSSSLQVSTMVSLDMDPSVPTLPISGPLYEDVSLSTIDHDCQDEIALSGRYTFWTKTAAFAYSASCDINRPTKLVWKREGGLGSGWKTNPDETNDPINIGKVNVYPNITSGVLYLRGLDVPNEYAYRIFSVAGQVIAEGKLEQNRGLDVHSFPSGQYFIQFTDTKGRVFNNIPFIRE